MYIYFRAGEEIHQVKFVLPGKLEMGQLGLNVFEKSFNLALIFKCLACVH